MPFMSKPVAFGSINFLPGFPGNSNYACDPWKSSGPSACTLAPVSVGRESGSLAGSAAMAAAAVAARRRGIVPAGLSGLGCGGSCGCGDTCGGKKHLSGASLYDDDGQWNYSLNGFNLSDLTADPVAWAKDNAVAIGLGAAVAYFIFGRSGRR